MIHQTLNFPRAAPYGAARFVVINELETSPGCVHILMRLLSKIAVSSFIGYLKERAASERRIANEMSQEMLAAISGLEFGEALKKLMSKNVCNYSFRLLEDTTGLDKNTISNLRKGANLTKLNVISTCLGIHIPFLVSNKILELAELALNLYLPGKAGAENGIYDSLLHLKWATDYDDIYEELTEQSYEHLIHQPK